MKHILTLMLLAAAALSAAAKDELVFDTVTHDFGTVRQDAAPVTCEYTYTNTSDEPVAILSVSASCGCTKPEYSAKPIAPGAKGKVKVTFLPAGQRGSMTKEVKVRWRAAKARSSQRQTLKFDITVEP